MRGQALGATRNSVKMSVGRRLPKIVALLLFVFQIDGDGAI
jgi:hypothetical protein